ncbi:nitroreductase family protein [Thermodesulfobacteriota bacterium]
MFISLIKKRRSIRKFLKRPVENEKIDLLIEAALRPPSSMGRMPWEFIVVKDQGLLEKLSRSKNRGSAFIMNAPLAIVVCADPEKSDVWIEDTSIASTYIFLAAESLGLGGCWIQIRKRSHNEEITSQVYISDLLDIDNNLEVLSIIALGYPDEELPPHEKDTLKYDRIHLDMYGNLYENKS